MQVLNSTTHDLSCEQLMTKVVVLTLHMLERLVLVASNKLIEKFHKLLFDYAFQHWILNLFPGSLT